MTLANELRAALPRGVHIEQQGPLVVVVTKHPTGPVMFTVPAGGADETIAEVARILRRLVEIRGPIAATIPGEA